MDSLIDFVFPREERPSVDDARKRKEEEGAAVRAVEETTTPKTYCDAYEKLIEEDGERLKSVESRLSSILGLTSITATLLISGILALLNGTLGDSSKVVRGIAGAGAVYLSLQIICSTLAAVRGLSRATWIRPSLEDLIEPADEGSIVTTRKRAIAACKRYQSTDRNVNHKVTQMAIAHAAIRNFAAASVIISILGFGAVLFQPAGDATAKAIRKDTELQKLLRGPQGPSGPPGPASSVPASAASGIEPKTCSALPGAGQSKKPVNQSVSAHPQK
jgi:hypothetical protein